MEFYPEGCRKSLAKTFESVEEIKNAMMKNESRARYCFATGSIIYILT